MAFENIDCINPTASTNAMPSDGVRVTSRSLARKKSGAISRFIRVQVGSDLARKLSLTQEDHSLRVLFGTDNDAGKVQISVDNTTGKFRAKRDKQGRYSFTINAATADGLFSLEFPSFDRSGLEAIRPQNGQPPHTVFTATKEMLEADD